jgi:hypothetical protein
MAVVSLQTSNVFSYTFSGHGNTHFNHIVVANNTPVLNLGGQSWTVECWLKPINRGVNGAYASVFNKRRGTGGTNGTDISYLGYLGATGFVSYYNGTNFESGRTLLPNTWNHVAWVFNQGANLRIFINGTNVLTSTAVTAVNNIDSAFHIGGNGTNDNSQYFGDISNFRIVRGQALYSGDFNISKFPVQLPNNAVGYHAGTTNVAASLTGNVVLLTCNDDTIKTDGNTPIQLNTNGYVYPHVVETLELQNFSYAFPANATPGNRTVLVTSVNNSLNLNTDFTIETWYYPTTNTGVLLERGYAGVGNNNASYILLWDTTNNNLNFAVANANNAAYSVGSLTGPTGSLGSPTINAWNHIAVTRAGNSYRGFLNGNLNLNLTNANTPYAALGRGLTIGGMFNSGQTHATGIPSNTINGFISNLRIIRGNSIYNAAFTANTTQALNVTNTVLLTGLTPSLIDLTDIHTIATNGMSQITFSTFSPFTANAVSNANGSSPILVNAASGGDLFRIYNKFNYQDFGQMVNIYHTVGEDQGRIYDKIESSEFAMSVPVYNTIGQDQGRIYDKIESAEFAYIPVGGAGGGVTGNIEYQFWS